MPAYLTFYKYSHIAARKDIVKRERSMSRLDVKSNEDPWLLLVEWNGPQRFNWCRVVRFVFLRILLLGGLRCVWCSPSAVSAAGSAYLKGALADGTAHNLYSRFMHLFWVYSTHNAVTENRSWSLLNWFSLILIHLIQKCFVPTSIHLYYSSLLILCYIIQDFFSLPSQ